MCGIYLSCSTSHAPDPGGALRSCLEKRGPDSCKTIGRRTQGPGKPRKATKQPPIFLKIFSTVLSLRGDVVVEQPLVDPDTTSVLCWNGEAWKIDGKAIIGNDAEAIFNHLVIATTPDDSNLSTRYPYDGESHVERVVGVFSRITGPYAFVYYDACTAQIFYGRDVLGRRSLLINKHRKESFAISSICDPDSGQEWEEVPTDGIYVLDLCNEWDRFKKHSAENVQCDKDLGFPTYAFSDPLSIIPEIQQFCPFNKSEPNSQPLALTQSSLAVGNLAHQLEASLRLRAADIPVPSSEKAKPPRLAILFSGGLDCSILARLVHDIVPKDQEIDLLNVAFENPRVVEAMSKYDQSSRTLQNLYAMCPDRITGISSHGELMKVCPGRNWRFVCIDVPYTETVVHRPQIISLIQPHNTEMDLSIACALYFAARAMGTTYNCGGQVYRSYTTPARVLLSGLGADEIFGGYQRHATAFIRGGYSTLIDELELDFNRIGKRNLGRDDRVISHWGKEVRYPYLDESLVKWALSLPVWEKCGFGTRDGLEDGSLPRLEPGKRLLRLLAWSKGLHGIASEKKRAIQFGARTAKMESGKVKGTQPLC